MSEYSKSGMSLLSKIAPINELSDLLARNTSGQMVQAEATKAPDFNTLPLL